jgi:hypothetical protein
VITNVVVVALALSGAPEQAKSSFRFWTLVGVAATTTLIAGGCGAGAALIDAQLSDALIAARDGKRVLNDDDFRSQQLSQDVLLGCTAVAGVGAIASTVGAFIVAEE